MPENNSSVVRGIVYALPIAVGIWALIGVVIAAAAWLLGGGQ